MAHHKRRSTTTLFLEPLESRDAPSVTPAFVEAFDTTPVGTLPAGWSQYANSSGTGFAVSSAPTFSAPHGLAVSTGAASSTARAWVNTVQPADEQVGVNVFLNSLTPVHIFARGQNLASATPSYYAVTIFTGLELHLVRVGGGTTTVLGLASSATYFSDQWVRVTLSAVGTSLKAQVFRYDTNQYLTSTGQWQSAPAWALTASDATLPAGGQAGITRLPSYAGTVSFDDFSIFGADGDTQAPVVTISAPAAGATLTAPTTVQVSPTDNLNVSRVQFYVDGNFRATDYTAPFSFAFDTATAANGSHTVMARAYDVAGNVGQASVAVTVQLSPALPPPSIPQHYPNIRIAELAYDGNPMGTFEDQLLSSSVDLVIPSPVYMTHIHAVAPQTPQLTYTNTSSLYLNLLTDWLTYADQHGISREEAFYHVSQPTGFSGSSPSSQPVNWFWGVYRTSGTTATNLTVGARGLNQINGVPFGGVGTSLAIGYPDRFREINVEMFVGAGGLWSAALEYPTAVDAQGNPTAWAPLKTLSDTTGALRHTGQILFDPPPDWKPAVIGGSARLYYVRYRTTADGFAPIVTSLLGRDYVNAGGNNSGTIPVFDKAADLNKDGYLSNSEYALRAPGKNARFLYESRAFAGYGQMRPATNPSDAAFRAWAADFDLRLLNSQPFAAGLFMDNSGDLPPVAQASVLESIATYGSDYATLLRTIAGAIAPRWILANTAGGGSNADPVIAKNPAYLEEFALQPLAQTWVTFQDVAAQVNRRASLTSPPPYAVLDSLPRNGSPTDPRMELATLAEYYLLADPQRTFLLPNGGNEPSTSWTRHWFAALAYNVGKPLAAWSQFAAGTDPANAALTYRVYQRPYSNALVLYKPLSSGSGSSSLADASATTHALGGTYRPLHADGTLGAAVTSITLRNGEGAVLIKV